MMQWKQYLTSVSSTVSEEDIHLLELSFGVTMPEDAKRLLMSHQGQTPENHMIDSEELMPVMFGPVLISETPKAESDAYGIIRTHRLWAEYYEGLVPIAESGSSSNAFALDFSKDPKNPVVVFIDHEADPESEDALIFVASSVGELLDNLKSPAE